MDVPPADPAVASIGTTDLTGPPLAPAPSADVEELDSFDPLEPPPLDWRSDSSCDEEDPAADTLTDVTDSLDKASPSTPAPFPLETTGNVEESVKNSPVLENLKHVYAANVGTDAVSDLAKGENGNFNTQDANASQESTTDMEEHIHLDVQDNQPTSKISENVYAGSLDKENQHEASDFNPDANANQETTINLEHSLDVWNNQPTENISELVCAPSMITNSNKEEASQFEASSFNKQDANANQEHATHLEEHRSLELSKIKKTTQYFENLYAACSDINLVKDLGEEDQNEVRNFNKQDANANQEHATNLEGHSLMISQSATEMEAAFHGDNGLLDLNQHFKCINDSETSKSEVYKIIETEFEGSYAASEDSSRHSGREIGQYGFDETRTGKTSQAFESESEGKENYQVKHPDMNNTDSEYFEDEDHSRIHSLLNQLQVRGEEREDYPSRSAPPQAAQSEARPPSPDADETTGLLFAEDHQRHVVGLLQCSELPESRAGEVDAVVSVSYNQEDTQRYWGRKAPAHAQREDSFSSQPDDEEPEPVWMKLGEEPPELEAAAGTDTEADDQPSYKDVPGPCDPEDLLDGVIFGAKYLGSTQLRSDRTPSTNARMAQAQEAVDRIKAPEGETQPMTEVDLFISTKRIKVLTADTQEAMMDHPLQMISYIADIGEIVVLMARRKRKGPDAETQKKCLMICHVFTSEDAQVIAQAIGQAFGVAYQQFLQVNGIRASELRPGEYSHYLESQELYNGDLAHFSDAHNLKEVAITKPTGEMLGLAVVESGWGSILPTVVVANMLHGGPAERCGELSIGDRIMSVNGTSLVGLPIHTCQNIIRDLKSQKYVKLSIVHCPPVTMAIIRRPDPKFQLGFSVEDGIICSLMRGGIAERGGIRVGHRIIEINGQSVVATTHDKIIQTLTNAVGEIHLKTMPASTYRLLTGQEQPVYL